MKGRIYKLTSPNTDMIYIGSTTQKLADRLNGHKSDSQNPNVKGSSSIIMFKYGDVSIHLIRECECDNIRIEEQIELDKYDGKLCNQHRAYQSEEIHKKVRKQCRDKYRQTDKGKAMDKAYKQTEKCKARDKAYKQTEKYKAMYKAYRQTDKCKNKEKEYKNIYTRTDEYRSYRRQYMKFKKSEFGLLCKMAIIYDI